MDEEENVCVLAKTLNACLRPELWRRLLIMLLAFWLSRWLNISNSDNIMISFGRLLKRINVERNYKHYPFLIPTNKVSTDICVITQALASREDVF